MDKQKQCTCGLYEVYSYQCRCGLAPAPPWLEAQRELLRLRERLADLEDHVEHHDREEFGTCDVCDVECYAVETELEQHIATWASTWAEQAVELYSQKELLVAVLQVQRVELSERITGDSPRWDVWLLDLVKAIRKALRAVSVEPYSAELRMP